MSDIDLPPGVGIVGSQIRWLALSSNLDVIGEVHPARGITLSNDTGASIMRSLRSFTLRDTEVSDLNLNTDRVMPMWEYEDGSHAPGYSGWPCGVFMFGSRVKERGSINTMHNATLMDQGYQLDQEMSKSYGVSSHSLIYPRFIELLNYGGILKYDVEPSEQRVKDPINWPIGTLLSKILKDMCRLMGFYNPWFSNTGRLTTRTPQELVEDAETRVYDLDTRSGRVIQGTVRENDNLLDAPNVYVVVSNGPTGVEIAARSYIDSRLPHSVDNIRYERPKVIRLQGLTDVAHAQRIADAYAAGDSNQYQVVEFDSAPDPRHDTFDTVRYDGILTREMRWTLPMQPGGVHHHYCTRGAYDPGVG